MNRKLLLPFLVLGLSCLYSFGQDTINLVDIENSFALVDTIPDVANGSIIVLDGNMTYEIGSEELNKGLKFVTEVGSESQAIIQIANNFWMGDSVIVDSVVFENIFLRGQGGGYVFNSGNKHYINKVAFRSCHVQSLGGLWRGKASDALISDFIVDDCVFDTIGEYGLLTVKSADSVTNISITNSTINHAQAFLRVSGSIETGKMENLTINKCPLTVWPGTLINFGGSVGDFEITNVIIGPGLDGYVSGMISDGTEKLTVTNSYYTSDFLDTSDYAIPGLIAYSNPSSNLWKDPDNGNFKIKDNDFDSKFTAGDPRWKPAALKSLSVNIGELDPAFSVDEHSYSVTLPSGTTAVIVSATPESEDAEISGTGVIDVSSGSGTATVIIKEGDISQTYSISFTVDAGSSLSKVLNADVSMYYNAVSDMIVIDNSQTVALLERVDIYSITGGLIMSEEPKNYSHKLNINTNMLNSGVYLIRGIYSDNTISCLKFTK